MTRVIRSPDYRDGYDDAIREITSKIEAAQWPNVQVLRKPDMSDITLYTYFIACRDSETVVEVDCR